MGAPLVGVVGHPIGHSLSPAIHNAALRHDGREGVYEAFDVEPSDFEAFIERMRTSSRGLNVTVPHKSVAFDLCDERSEEANATRAVNTLLFDDGRIAGHNTDVVGVARALDELGVASELDSALVLGAGGAGRAACRALGGRAATITVANRTTSRAEEAAALCDAEVVAWEDRGVTAAKSELIVNATSVGLDGADSPLDVDDLRSDTTRWVLDLVYRRGETELVRRARTAGVRAAEGLVMLVHQAAEAYRLFWAADPPVDVMRNAAFIAAKRRTQD